MLAARRAERLRDCLAPCLLRTTEYHFCTSTLRHVLHLAQTNVRLSAAEVQHEPGWAYDTTLISYDRQAAERQELDKDILAWEHLLGADEVAARDAVKGWVQSNFMPHITQASPLVSLEPSSLSRKLLHTRPRRAEWAPGRSHVMTSFWPCQQDWLLFCPASHKGDLYPKQHPEHT